jgi:hypothetical protein
MDTPTVRNTVSFPITVLSYTSQSAAAGVPAELANPILYVNDADAVLQMAIVERTAVVPAGASYKVAYVPVDDVP